VKIKSLHDWNVTYAEAIRIQERLKDKVILEDAPGIDNISILGGADISYNRGDDLFFAGIVLLRFPEMEVIEEAEFSGKVLFPYIPGLLSFREGPVLLEAFKKLRNCPDVVLFDGQGIAHPRGLGLASHMGLFLDIPTIGSAKTRLFGKHEDVGKEPGDFSYLFGQDTIIGAALRTKKNVKPIYVSPGHRIGLASSIRIVLSSCRSYRIPEPIRRAHLLVNRMRQDSAGLEG
jgi:deoxyribonuclease V